MPPVSPESVRAACASLGARDAALYTLLVVAEPTSLTEWSHLAARAGQQATAMAQHTLPVLRDLHVHLLQLGLVAPLPARSLACPPGVRGLAWRWAATRPGLAQLTSAALGRWVDERTAARIALYGGAPDVVAAITRLAHQSPEAVDGLALEATESHDHAWLDSLPADGRRVLLERALVTIERAALPNLGAYGYVARRLNAAEPLSPTVQAAFAGIAVARGELEQCRELLMSPAFASVHAPLRAALAFAEGRAAAAREALGSLEPPKRGSHLGVVALLVVLAMRAEGAVVAASPWLRLGSAKGAPFGASFGTLADLLADQPSRARHVGDIVQPLLAQLDYLESPFAPHPSEQVYFVDRMQEHATVLASRGYRWLAEQYAFAGCAIRDVMPEKVRAHVRDAPVRPTAPLGPSLLEARSSRQSWEIDLDRIEAALPKLASRPDAEAPAARGARVVWRVSGSTCVIEPYLQKRSAGGKWSAGRKLSVKHLMGDAPGLDLPPEDLAIARFAREMRENGYYPSTHWAMDARAWLALVGHPRVLDAEGEARLEVVRGEVKVVSRPTAGGSEIALEPLFAAVGVHARREEGRVVVYEVTASMKPLLTSLVRPVLVPPEGKARLGAVLHRLAGLVQVETSDQLEARAMPADETIYVRLVASDGGLSVTLLVRPLGPGTTPLTPGRGATSVVAKVEGEVTQAARDLGAEVARAEIVLAACPVLQGDATSAFVFKVADPEECLAVIAAMRDLGSRVVMEWPQGSPLRVRKSVGRTALRGGLKEKDDGFWFRGTIRVDGDLDVDVERMLELIAEHPGRYVAVAPDEYVELEQDLRDVLASLAAARTATVARGKVAEAGMLLPSAAIGLLTTLTEEGAGITTDVGVRRWRERLDDAFRRAAPLPKGFRGELRDYQLEGYRWMSRLCTAGLGACLADDMGLGKTVQIIALLLQRAGGGAALVVAPTSVCEGWCRELERFAPTLRVRRAFGPVRAEAMRDWKRREVVITSYTLLQQDAAAFQAQAWTTVVLDEAQLVKNADTLRAKAAVGLRAEARVVATGTPVENYAGDLYSLFAFLNPGLLGSQKEFLARIEKGGGGLSRAVKRQLQPFILRRTKAEVLDDLPPVTEIQRDVVLSPGEAKLYDSVRRVALDKMLKEEGRERIRMFAELTRLRRLCCHPDLVAPEAGLPSAKLDSFMELVEELVGARHRALVFSQFTDVLALVRPLLEAKNIGYQYLDGSTSTRQRAAAVDAFQDGEGDLFLISLKAGGFGLNLTAADYVIHLDPWWNPAVESQASDRAHRIGQTRPVTVYRLVNVGTIEERIMDLHRKKRDLAEAVLADTDKSGKLTATEMRALLETD